MSISVHVPKKESSNKKKKGKKNKTRTPSNHSQSAVVVRVVEPTSSALTTPRSSRHSPSPQLPQDHKALMALVQATRVKQNAALRGLAQLMGPHEVQPYRLYAPGMGSTMMKTYVQRLPNKFTLSIDPILDEPPQGWPYMRQGSSRQAVWALEEGYMQFVLTDDPIVSLIHPVITEMPEGFVYNLDGWMAPSSGDDGTITLQASHVESSEIHYFDVPICGDGLRCTGGPYGDLHPMGVTSEGDYYFWIDANANNSGEYRAIINIDFSITCPQPSTIRQCYVTGDQLTHNAGRPVFTEYCSSPIQTVASGLTVMYQLHVSDSGYYRFHIKGNIYAGGAPQEVRWFLTPGTLAYNFKTAICSKHEVNAAVQALGKSLSAARMNGVSLLLTNTTPELLKGGTGIGYCASAESELWNDLTPQPDKLNTLNAELTYDEAWSKGFYAYVRPREFGRYIETYHSRGTRGTCNGDFADPWGLSVISLKPSRSLTQSGAQGPTLLAQLFTTVEFFSTNPIFDLRAPTMSGEAFELFVSSACKGGPPFSANEGHLSLIRNAIKSSARFIGDVLEPGIKWTVSLVKALSSDRPISSAFSLLDL